MSMTVEHPRLSEADFERMLGLIKGADSVELKLTMPDTNLRPTAARLGLDPLDAQIRQVFFFDTPDLALNHHGVVVRARRVQRRDADVVVKLRPVAPDELPKKLRKSPSLTVEVDAMPGGFVCSAALKERLPDEAVKAVAHGEAPLRKLLTKEQRRFYAEHAPEGLDLKELQLLGPIVVMKLRFKAVRLGRSAVVELWTYPDYSRILELSTKCLPREALTTMAETRALLAASGVDLTGEQQTKTKTALEFFARQRAEQAA
jgi:hypothetical protein